MMVKEDNRILEKDNLKILVHTASLIDDAEAMAYFFS